MPAEPADPTADDARTIVGQALGLRVRSIRRFGTGSSHFVYDVVTTDAQHLVVRLSRARDLASATGSVFWSDRLRPLGVPLPRILHADLTLRHVPYPVTVLDRLPGTDLGNVIQALTSAQLWALACALHRHQIRIGAQHWGTGYGFAPDPGRPPHTSWDAVLRAELRRTLARIRAARVVDPDLADPVRRALDRACWVRDIPPTPFLHDITTKNVIIDSGRLSGIVDVDDLCFGDPLYLPALMRMALAAHDRPMTYYEHWLALIGPDRAQRRALDLYAAIHALGFLAELGQVFNRARAARVNPAYRARLLHILRRFTAAISSD